MMRLSVAQRSECGGRQRNEDWLGFCGNDTLGCFVLADGCGGYGGGAVAARHVVRQVLSQFAALPEVGPKVIAETIPVARMALMRARERYPRLSEMDTTLVALQVDTKQGVAYWSSLGDSRIYLFRHGRAHVLTSDHSVLQSMIEAGLMGGEARGSNMRNTLYATVGSGNPPRSVCDEPLILQSGDIFLLCSDGFWESVREDAMESQLQGADNPARWLDDMVDQVANPTSDEQDNFSALAVWIGDREEQTRVKPLRQARAA